MKKSLSKKLLSGALSAMMFAAAVPSSMVSFAADRCDQGKTSDGYDWELWNQNNQGQASMNLGSNGGYSCSWSNIQNVLFRTGKKLGSTKGWQDYNGIQYNYDVDYTPKGNSYMCVYGWTEDPTVEYYIVEAWGDWRPPGSNNPKASLTVDNKQYDLFTSTRVNQPSIHGTETFEQYWSVRKTNDAAVNQKRNLKGTITVSDHFAAWEKAGMKMGKMYEVAFNIEGYMSSGEANVKTAELKMGNIDTSQNTGGDNNGGNTGGNNNGGNNGGNTNPWGGGNTNPWGGGNTGGNNGGNNGSSTSQSDSLKEAFAPWFKFGTSVSPGELNSGADFLKKNYSSITPENELKPDAIIDQNASKQKGNNVDTQVNLSRAAQTLKFCESNGISLRGHTFVWYSQTPDWFFKENFDNNGAWVSKDIMDKRLESFIKNTFAAIKQQYPKLDLYSYDVCNELFKNDGGGMRPSRAQDGNQGSRWVQIYGDDSFVINAFKYARQYAPEGCKLYLNDYNEYIGAKTTDLYNMAMKLKELGYIDGIGMQSHLATNYPDAKTYETALKKFLSTGLEVQITELDITCSDFTSQANLYEDIFKLAMQNADKIPAVTIWGTTDNVSWRSSQNPLLFSQGYKPKQAYDKIMALTSTMPKPSGGNTEVTTAPPAVVTTTPVQTTAKVEASLWGDANIDKNVDMSDAVIIMQSLANPSKYTLKDQGKVNGDVNLSGNGITSADALAVQKYLVGTLTKLPESYSENNTSTTPTQQQTNAPAVTTQAPAASNKSYVSANFSSGSNSFTGRGDASVTVDKDSYISSPSSLYISGRTDNWHGAAIDLDVEPGNTYSFSAGVMQATGSAEDIQMTLQYTLDGEDNYDMIDSATCKDKEWTVLSNKSFAIPSGAKNIILYFEMPGSKTADFYLDDVTVASGGTAVSIDTSGAKSNPSTTTVVTTPSTGGTTGGTLDASKPMIAVSFDDGAVGSSPTASSMRIINALADQGFNATFFYVGSWTQNKGNDGAQEIKYAYQKGMEIANHTWTHPQNLPSMGITGIQDEVNKTANLLKQITGAEPAKLLRLPYLNNGSAISQALPDYGLVTCQIDTQDWNNASADQIYNTIKQAIDSGSGNGAVVLCHETYDTTATAIEKIAPYAKQKGWQIAAIGDMYKAKGKSIPGGQEIKKVY